MTKFAKWKKWQKLIQGLYPNHMLISRPWQKHVQSFKNIGIKLYEELRSQGTYYRNTFIESEVRRWQSSQWWKSNKINGRIISKPHAHLQTMEKVTKLMEGLYPNHMHIFRPWRKHVQSFKKIGIKLYEELCSQGTHCLYTEVEKWLSSQSGKSDKK